MLSVHVIELIMVLICDTLLNVISVLPLDTMFSFCFCFLFLKKVDKDGIICLIFNTKQYTLYVMECKVCVDNIPYGAG